MKVLAVKPELCIGCGVCEVTCANLYFKVSDRTKSAIRVTVPPAKEQDCIIEFCTQCGECIAVCPTQALYRAKNGIVRLRKKDCVGCNACVGFCPSLVMYTQPDDIIPFRCVACGKCADDCPPEALYMAEVDAPPDVTELTRSIRLKTGEVSHGH